MGHEQNIRVARRQAFRRIDIAMNRLASQQVSVAAIVFGAISDLMLQHTISPSSISDDELAALVESYCTEYAATEDEGDSEDA